MVHDRDTVTVDDYLEIGCALSNGRTT